MIRWLRTTLALLLLVDASGLLAHEVRPAVLEATETAVGVFHLTWKVPILEGRALPVEPVLPDDCETLGERTQTQTPGALVERWRVRCSLRQGTLAIAGLSATLIDVMVQLHYLDDEQVHALLRPNQTSLALAQPIPAVTGYFALGVEHLLFGIDHLLFVTGLVLFIRRATTLLKTVTAFTVAHSVTLALSVLGFVHLEQGPVEAVIALSILFLARELMLPEAARSGLMQVSPWVMAFAFGLLHGFGFAGALSEIGLPREALGLALLLFNLGIEAGQLAIVGVLLASGLLVPRLCAVLLPTEMAAVLMPRLLGGATLAMGSLAGFWTVQRIAVLI